jgi:hypothetical protein
MPRYRLILKGGVFPLVSGLPQPEFPLGFYGAKSSVLMAGFKRFSGHPRGFEWL